MAVLPIKIPKEIQVKALQLYAAGYRALDTATPKIGQIDINKLRRFHTNLNPVLIQLSIGMPRYTKNIQSVSPLLYHCLMRLQYNEGIEPYKIMLEQYEIL